MTSTLATEKQSQAIRDRMQIIRNELPYDADAARERVRQLTDWKYYLRSHPLPVLAAAAAVGYFAIPSEQKPRVLVQTKEGEFEAPAAKKGVLGGIGGALLTMAIRSGTSLASKHLTDVLASGSAHRSRGELPYPQETSP